MTVNKLSTSHKKWYFSLSQRQRQQGKYALWGVVGLLGVSLVDRTLLLSGSLGLTFMILLYSYPPQQWYKYWQEWQNVLKGPNQQLTIAVILGGITTLLTYLGLSLGNKTESPELALTLILEGLGIMVLLGLSLVEKTPQDRESDQGFSFDRTITQLTENDPLKRLIALRQLIHHYRQQSLTPEQEMHLYDYLQVMILQEENPLIQNTLQESLKLFSLPQSQPLQPLKLPLTLSQKLKHPQTLP